MGYVKKQVFDALLIFILGCAIQLNIGCGGPSGGSAGRSAGSPAGERQFVDAMDRVVDVQLPVKRIVSLSPSVTEILFAIEADETIVGVTDYCNYPEEAREKTKVGGFSGATINIELLAALKPDLVILSMDMHYRIVDLFDQLGILTFAVEPHNFDGIFKTIEILGALASREDEGARLIYDMQKKISLAGEKGQGRVKPDIFWVVWDEPLLTAGGSSFISEAITLAGGRNIFEDINVQWPEVSIEQVLARQPDWILGSDDEGDMISINNLVNNPLFSHLEAIQNNRVGFLDSDMIYRYGPRLADVVLSIAEMIHK